MSRACALAAALLLLASAASAEPTNAPQYSPYADQTHATRVFWGDTHVHTSWSPDAGVGGNTAVTPEDAFRFARGETVTAHNGARVALRRPLDFLLVSDHSEYMGIYPMLAEELPALLATETGRRFAELIAQGERAQVGIEIVAHMPTGEDAIDSAAFGRAVWDRVIEHAERFNEPGRFTAFIGYEWSSMPDRANLHRNVLFRDGRDKVSQVVPFRSIDSSDPEELWAYLADYEEQTGGGVLAIPHNSNLSAGRMFELVDFDGNAFTRDYAERRRRWEPLVEATQIKGDSETAPFLSPDDEFADFGTKDQRAGMSPNPHEDAMYAGEYVRSALGNGLHVARETGINPFEFGLIGSTDAHTGLATADDDDFWGKFSAHEPHPGRSVEGWAANFVPPDRRAVPPEKLGAAMAEGHLTGSLVSSGYAGVWATENTREALFDAMRRRETYATTGPRMVVRFFGGWSFEDADRFAPDLAAKGYAEGVPMGDVLAPRPQDGAPSFLVSALRDPDGANLDRVQIVKQWVNADGERRERIYDVAVSDGREIGRDGRAREPVGSTVDVARARYANSIGAPQLTGVWRDPDFDPQRRAVYYARVLQIPTPHWTVYDAVRFGESRPEGAPESIQGRAYTSPIWYTP